ncbi:MAG: fibrobacter succinogenes major paralogous domain-containing protein, partial [Fibrobacter sp.]|nr:fibrobacter succinogenes major paralogous domain-containing protein [Fibrobacter sp.]
TSCTAKSVKNKSGLEGLEVTCGETVVDTIWNGRDGKDGEDGDNGTSCTAKSVKNKSGLEGLEVTCGETVVDTIWNGRDGKDGEDGDNGTSCTAKSVKNKSGLEGLEVTCGETVIDTIWNGKDGQNGNNGTSCTATVNQDGGFDLVCDGQTVGTITNGEDGVGCTLDDEGDGKVTVSCGKGSAMTTTILYKAVCGTKPYDPLKSFCSEGELYSCDDRPYDPKKQYCLEVTRDGSDIYSVEALLTDARDAQNIQVYKTVEICNNETSTCQTWMAENLNYSVNPDVQSWCGGGESGTTNEGDCSVYGRLYTWAAAMDSVAAFSNDGKGCGYGAECDPSGTVRGVCPEGWHLPSKDEWETLFTAVGGSSKAGTALKSQTGWYSQTGDAADRDAYGFSALPAGYRLSDGYFRNAGNFAFFWSASENGSYYAYHMNLYYDDEGAYLGDLNKYYGYSVRCLQNN